MRHVMELMEMECGAKRAQIIYITMAWFSVMVFLVIIQIGTQDKHFLLAFAQGLFWFSLVREVVINIAGGGGYQLGTLGNPAPKAAK